MSRKRMVLAAVGLGLVSTLGIGAFITVSADSDDSHPAAPGMIDGSILGSESDD